MKKITAIVLSLVMFFGVFSICGYAENQKKFYLVLGDSIAYGSGTSNSKEACYGKIVTDTNGYEYANHSVPSHTTTNLINRLKQDAVV
ncbi:MAG: SGNH/GDSL hydrolase family protein, partial [Clostridia bacterium]|nr:SGNH/GDSL hydrolase family protein [Clostridia bacterium]